ncbi:MAG: UvrD-helicase domain-containing protein [Gemmatimonadetes bacterium]|nr:UvrD-helicase domain-containing protein [Gemmatimonadota bacterium]MCY3944104.1 UvrD-helicase domain-containing protein [Gemmatimonadota bacterium]
MDKRAKRPSGDAALLECRGRLVHGLLADEAARRSICEDLDDNLLVEAGAGSGKTTELVNRMVALVRTGATQVEEIAAVTFTRKAAAELRERFQIALEKSLSDLRDLPAETAARERLGAAIQGVDAAFLGTIHAFCARLLRERPLGAGLDPGFREIEEAEAEAMRRRFWVDFQERMATDGDERLSDLARLGVPLERLEAAFATVEENPDVDFGFAAVPATPPEAIDLVRTHLDELLDRAAALLPDRTPQKGWDPFATRMRTLLYRRRAFDWSDDRVLFDALTTIHRKRCALVQNRWSDTASGKQRAKTLCREVEEFAAPGGAADLLLARAWAHRYPVAMGIARDAARAFAEERRRLGLVSYQDLLVLTRELLASEPDGRRELAARFPRILVDEFQDTDPLQAEILLLLASDPETGDDWRRVEPRPGALFVVGDPKQSIYRFRRADIALYQVVKRRFEHFGKVLGLETNFRSLPAIGEIVQGAFDRHDRFGASDTDRQAAFAPLVPARTDEGPGLVAAYRIAGGNHRAMARDEAKRIATEISARVKAGERKAGDFMVLTRTRHHLQSYVRALERRGVPTDVSGAGVDFDEELAAFLLLLRCLEDPTHRTRVVGVLTGPLFGVTLEELVAYRDAGGFEINRRARGDGEVAGAVDTLHRWWKRAMREPADVTVERLVAETALFPLAAAEELGQLRAGAVAYLLDAVRVCVLEGDGSLAGAADAIEDALRWQDAEAPLVPGRGNCVRVMNLHRAKGLEAPVVFLAAPFGETNRPPRMRVARDESGEARGSTAILDRADPAKWFARQRRVIAQPLDWERELKEERDFEAAESVRLLYVAATRAKDELWIARSGPRGGSPWQALEEWVVNAAKRVPGKAGSVRLVELSSKEAPPPPELSPDVDLAPRLGTMRRAAERSRIATYRRNSVTESTKGGGAGGDRERMRRIRVHTFAPPTERPASGGREWGSVVHQTLAIAAEGVRGESLDRLARDLLAGRGRIARDGGEPPDIAALLSLVASVRASPIWKRAMASDEHLVELPFSLAKAASGEHREVLEGVIDLVFREGDRWCVVDYKADRGDDPDFASRVEEYRAQVDLYARCWEELTGAEVGERVLLFVAQGRAESW